MQQRLFISLMIFGHFWLINILNFEWSKPRRKQSLVPWIQEWRLCGSHIGSGSGMFEELLRANGACSLLHGVTCISLHMFLFVQIDVATEIRPHMLCFDVYQHHSSHFHPLINNLSWQLRLHQYASGWNLPLVASNRDLQGKSGCWIWGKLVPRGSPKYHQTKDHSQNGLGADPSPQWFFNPDPSSECIQED